MATTKQKSKPAKITQKSKPIVTAAPAVVMAAAELNRAGVKSMVPRSFDKFTGPEPGWDKPAMPENRQASLIKAFNWYNYSYGKKEAHDFVVDWLHRSGRVADAKQFRTVPDKQIINTMGVAVPHERSRTCRKCIGARTNRGLCHKMSCCT